MTVLCPDPAHTQVKWKLDEETEGESTGTSGPAGLPPVGYAESYRDNICILPSAGDPYMVSGGVLDDPETFAKQLQLHLTAPGARTVPTGAGGGTRACCGAAAPPP